MKRSLTIHIGLPKTATTFLQHWILKPALGHGFIHRTRGNRAKRVCRYFKELAESDDSGTKVLRSRIHAELTAHVARFPEVTSVVVSDENISGRAIRFWKGKGVEPARLADRLGILGAELSDLFTSCRVIVGVRRQDQWLASRYAESSTVFPDFGQQDFDRRMIDISHRKALGPVFDWLDFHKVHALLADALGIQNVLMLSMERLVAEPEAALADLGEFVGQADLLETYRKLIRDDVDVVRNSLSAGGDTWRLRRDNSLLHLSSEIRQALLGRLADSNSALSQLMRVHF